MKMFQNTIRKCLIIMLVLIALVALSGCSNNDHKSIEYHIGEKHCNMFTAQSEDCDIVFYSGIREQDYKINGMATMEKEFGILKLKPSRLIQSETLNCNLIINQTTYPLTLEKSPYRNEYLVDIEKQVLTSDNISVNGEIISKNVDLVMICVSNNFKVDCDEAYNIAFSHLNEKIEEFKAKNISYEYYLKIASDNKNQNNDYFWNFTIVYSNGERQTLMISTLKSEIVCIS